MLIAAAVVAIAGFGGARPGLASHTDASPAGDAQISMP
jgi:hypothetical protein